MDSKTINLEEYPCPNSNCSDFGIKAKGNIAVRGVYGKDDRPLLYCRTCGKRFASTIGSAIYGAHLPPDVLRQIIHHAGEGVGVRATARLLGLRKDTVNDVILRISAHCGKVLDTLLRSLSFAEVQFDELWAFVKKKKDLILMKTPRKSSPKKSLAKKKMKTSEESGSGQP
jgi:transposase-like protein